MSGTAALQSPVKDAIDAYSGRFEFFKQTLTLGSVGLAGIAALFTDPARIPTEAASKYAVAAAGLSLIAIVAFSAMGLSDYANLLTALARGAGLIPAAKPSHRPSEQFAAGVIRHAKVVIVALFCAWFSLTSFAGYRMFAPSTTTAETALATARVLVGKETGQPRESLLLTRLETDDEAYVATYYAQAMASETSVRVSKRDGTVIRVVQEKQTAPSGTKQP